MKINLDANNIGIKRSDSDSSLDGLFGYSASDVESKREIEVIGFSKFEEIVEEFKTMNGHLSLEDFTSDKVFTPAEINLVARLIESYHKDQNRGISAGLFLSQLIKNSYMAGNNEFNFNFSELNNPLSNFGYKLHATNDRPIKMKVVGNVGFNFCCASKGINAIFEGNTQDNFFNYAENSTVYVKGNLDYQAFFSSTNLLAVVKGDISFDCGFDSSELILVVDGNVVELCNAKEAYISQGILPAGSHLKITPYMGKDAMSHSKYIKHMQKWEEHFK
jgi:hypothetical protein